MDRFWGHFAEWNKLEKDKYYMISLTCRMWKKQTHRYIKQIGSCQKEIGEIVKSYKLPLTRKSWGRTAWWLKLTIRYGTYLKAAKKIDLHWLVWLSGLSASLWTKGSPVQFLVRAHASAASQVPSWGYVREATTHWCFSASLSPSLSLSLKVSK